MITLKRLCVENFKGLHSVDLLFPEHGSVLIEGHNEAGKSTLFEAVYVALYGKPLVGEEKMARQEEVIQHGQSRASVKLTFYVGSQELTITRGFERGKSQQASLIIRSTGVQPEEINRVRAVDERILKELGNLDGENLRNSCFVEQKELGRIEALSFRQREEAVQKLLGLERLAKLMDQFKFKREQERELSLAEDYLKLAHLQAEVRDAFTQEAEIAAHLDAVKVIEQIKRIHDLDVQRGEIEERLSICIKRTQQARERLERCDTVKQQKNRCDQADQQMAEVTYAHNAVLHVEQELDWLKRIEQTDLPAAKAHLDSVCVAAEAVALVKQARIRTSEAEEAVREAQRHLKELEQAEAEQQRREDDFAQAQARVVQRQQETEVEHGRIIQGLESLNAKKASLERSLSLIKEWETACEGLRLLQQEIGEAEAKEQNLKRLHMNVQERESEVHDREVAVALAERDAQIATDYARLATGYEALNAWVRLKGVEVALTDYSSNRSILATRRQGAEQALMAERMKTRIPLFAGIVLALLALLVLVLGVLWYPAFVLALLMVVGACIAWVGFFRARKGVQQKSSELSQCDKDLQSLDMHHQAAIQAGGDPSTISQHVQQLQMAGIAVPTNLGDGRALQEKLRRELGTREQHVLQETAQEARMNHARVIEQLRQARTVLKGSKEALSSAEQSGDPAAQLRRLRERLAEQKESVAMAEQRARVLLTVEIAWPTSSVFLQTALSNCQVEMRSAASALKQQELSTVKLIQEAKADTTKAEAAMQRAREMADAQRASDPAGQLSNAQEHMSEAQAVSRQQEEALQPLLQRVRLRAETEVEPERGRAELQMQTLEKQLSARPLRQEEWKKQKTIFTDAFIVASTMVESLLAASSSLAIAGLPSLPAMPVDVVTSLSYEQTLTVTLNGVREALVAALIALDEQGTRRIYDEALGEQGSIKHQKDMLEREARESQHIIDAILLSRKIVQPLEYTHKAIIKCWPLIAAALLDDKSQLEERLDGTRKRLYATQQQEEQLTAQLHHSGALLSIEECQQRVVELMEERRICEHAMRLIKETHDRIARRVLPITERNMQPLLQQLTGGRYRDVRLTPDESHSQTEEMDYRIRVWDPTAGRYVGKNLFSGGTRDQCSLALRLAFALATLPQELGVAPGFIFLDEPLSAFDAQRAQALVELATTGTIAQQFSQVVLISHNHAFDREAFQYHVRMEAGQVIETDLPFSESSNDKSIGLQTVRAASKQTV